MKVAAPQPLQIVINLLLKSLVGSNFVLEIKRVIPTLVFFIISLKPSELIMS